MTKFLTLLLVGVLSSAWIGSASLCLGQEEPLTAAPAAASGELETDHAAEVAHGDEHDGHSEFDLTTKNMSDSGEDAAEWRSEKAIATVIVFLLMLAGLYAVAWKPIAEGLEKREKTISGNISSAEKAALDAKKMLADYETKLANANAEAQVILADARKDAEASGQRLIAAAQEEAVRQRERAVSEIESAKRVALNELAEKSTDVAMSLAQRIVGREVNPSDHQNMIKDMLAKLPSQN